MSPQAEVSLHLKHQSKPVNPINPINPLDLRLHPPSYFPYPPPLLLQVTINYWLTPINY